LASFSPAPAKRMVLAFAPPGMAGITAEGGGNGGGGGGGLPLVGRRSAVEPKPEPEPEPEEEEEEEDEEEKEEEEEEEEEKEEEPDAEAEPELLGRVVDAVEEEAAAVVPAALALAWSTPWPAARALRRVARRARWRARRAPAVAAREARGAAHRQHIRARSTATVRMADESLRELAGACESLRKACVSCGYCVSPFYLVLSLCPRRYRILPAESMRSEATY
jgi:hypothetical protein